MAKPDEPAKFNMVWRNLDRALSMPVFSKVEVALMQIARELSYTASVIDGSGRAKPFRVFPSKVAQHRGLCRELVSRGITALLEDNVWKGTRDRIRINKDYRSWAGAHKLTPEQIRECDEAMNSPVTACGMVVSAGHEHHSGAGSHVSDKQTQCDPGVTLEGSAVTQESHLAVQSVTQESQRCDSWVTLGGAKCDPGVTAQNPPLEPPVERARQTEYSDRERVNHTERARPSDDDNNRTTRAPRAHAGPSPGSVTPSVRNDPTEIARVARLAERLFPMLDFGPKVDATCEWYPASWVRAALERASNRGVRRWDYIDGILRRFESEGGPSVPRAATASRPVAHIPDFIAPTGPRKGRRPPEGDSQ